jgi:hypothetical protein
MFENTPDDVQEIVVEYSVGGGILAHEAPGADASVETLLAEGVWYDAITRGLADTTGTPGAVH